MRIYGMTVAVMLAAASAAQAQTVPVLSGKYATNYSEICQASIPASSSGSTYTQILVANFNTKKATVQLTGTSVTGDLVVISGSGGLTQSAMSATWPYTNTATTLTINGVVFNVSYGALKKGVAQSLVFGGITSGGCAANATAVHQ